MNNRIKVFVLPIFSFLILLFLSIRASAENLAVSIHLRGVYESKITLLPLSGPKQFKSVTEVQGVKNGETATLQVPSEYLPGEFVLRFDYKEKNESTSYPSEKRILINNQDIELWVNPMYANNPDSAWFQKDERENATYASFINDNSKHKEKLSVLQQFLMNYDDTNSKFYRQGIEEYESRRETYNQWLVDRTEQDKDFFASSLYRFNFVPKISWQGSEKERIFNAIHHYFDGIDFNDPVIIKTSQMNDWMNTYVNLHMQMATTVPLRDSLISAAAYSAIEKAKLGNPVVYGWMVDYFYRGFETNNIPVGMKVLEPYLDDPNCLTSKRMEIERRLKGMQSLLVGTKAPGITLLDSGGRGFDLDTYNSPVKYILLMFWSADCSHCMETVNAVYPWQQQPDQLKKMEVIAISLDETETEVKAYENKIKELSGWKHLQAVEGINSKVANDYYILATPVMILLDAKTKSIVGLPENFVKLKELIQ